MATQTTTVVSRPGWVGDDARLDLYPGGAQIDWARTSATYADPDGNKFIPSGTIMSRLGSGLLVPRKGTALGITSITRSGAVATVTQVAHGLAVGDTVLIAGAVETEYNGYHVVATVPTADTFTYAVTGTPVSPATGTITMSIDAIGLLYSPAQENSKVHGLTGYGLVIGGAVWKNLLPETTEGSFETWLAEVKAAGTGYFFRTYSDSRIP